MDLSVCRKEAQGYQIDLFLFFIVAFFIGINFHTSFTVLPVYVIQLGGTELHSGLQSTVFLVTAVILRFYFGPLADKKGVKLPLLISSFVFCTSPLFFLLCNNVWQVFLVRVYQSIGLASYFSSASAFVSDLATEGKLGLYIGFYRLVITLTLLTGPVIASWVINTLDMKIWLIASFIMGLLAFFCMCFINCPSINKNKKKVSLKKMCSLLKSRQLKIIYLSFLVTSFSFGTILTSVTVYIAKYTDFYNEGFYFTYFALASIIANISAGHLSDKYGRPIIVWPAIMLLSLGVGILSLLNLNLKIVFLSSVLAGLGYAGAISALVPWLVENVSGALKSSALALQENAIDLGCAAGAFLYSILSSLIGDSFSYGVIGLIGLLSVNLIRFKNIKI